MATSTSQVATVCGLLLCLAGLHSAEGLQSGTLVLTEGGNSVQNATLLVAYTPEGTPVSTVNQTASVPGLFVASPPALSPDGKYAFQIVGLLDVTNDSQPVLVTDLDSGTVATVADVIQAPPNCTFQTGLELTGSTIAVGHGHAPGTYFLYGLLVCVNGETQLLPTGPVNCSDEYLVRYIYTAATKTFVLAEQYYISHSFNCRTPWATKTVIQMSYVNGTLYGLGYKSERTLDDHEAVYPFDTHARVFRTAATEPSTGAGSTCSDTLAIAIVSADASYLVCSNTNSIIHTFGNPRQLATLLPAQPGLDFSEVATAATSPYVFALATSVNATPYDAGVIKSPATVFAVLKETNELVHQFVIRRGAGGLAVVP